MGGDYHFHKCPPAPPVSFLPKTNSSMGGPACSDPEKGGGSVRKKKVAYRRRVFRSKGGKSVVYQTEGGGDGENLAWGTVRKEKDTS